MNELLSLRHVICSFQCLLELFHHSYILPPIFIHHDLWVDYLSPHFEYSHAYFDPSYHPSKTVKQLLDWSHRPDSFEHGLLLVPLHLASDLSSESSLEHEFQSSCLDLLDHGSIVFYLLLNSLRLMTSAASPYQLSAGVDLVQIRDHLGHEAITSQINWDLISWWPNTMNIWIYHKINEGANC